MRPSYADLARLMDDIALPDRVPNMPMVGLLTGFGLALGLWTAIGWLLWHAL